MRAGPLSKSKVVELLNAYFVPVLMSNQKFTPESAAIVGQLHRQMQEAGFKTTAVHGYVVAPDGKPLRDIDPFKVTPAEAVRILQSVVDELHLTPGPPIVRPKAVSRPAEVPPPDSVILHTMARDFVREGTWADYPGEAWVVFPASQIPAILGQGEKWDLPDGVTKSVLTHFYPLTEDNNADVDRNRIELATLHAQVISKGADSIMARLDGKLRMSRAFHQGHDDFMAIEATIAGYIEFSHDRKRILRWRLATDLAQYGRNGFMATARFMPASLFIETGATN